MNTMGDAVIPSRWPKSRQKNCNGCVQAKRRCDRSTPVCSRCAEKKVACIYGKTASEFSSGGESASVDVSMSGQLLGTSADTLNPFDWSVGPTPDEEASGAFMLDVNATEPIQDFLMDSSIELDLPSDASLGLVGSFLPQKPSQWIAQVNQNAPNERSASPVDEEVLRSYDKMGPVCDTVEPWHLYDSRTLLHYLVERLKGFVNDIASRSTAPFLHRYLYRDLTPPCIVSCFATCVLYTNRTSDNTSMVMRAIHANVKDLTGTESHRLKAMPVEKLARTQALFLYQIIRLLDGDVTLRSQGEGDIPLLETWLGELCRLRENMSGAANFDQSTKTPQPSPYWESWIFAESVRRTIVIAYSFIRLYEMMKGEDDQEEPDVWSFAHRWTLSRHLWEAASPSEFARMWSEKPRFTITNYSFDHFLEYGRGDDVDEFSEILLTTYIGVDETKEFIASTKHVAGNVCNS